MEKLQAEVTPCTQQQCIATLLIPVDPFGPAGASLAADRLPVYLNGPARAAREYQTFERNLPRRSTPLKSYVYLDADRVSGTLPRKNQPEPRHVHVQAAAKHADHEETRAQTSAIHLFLSLSFLLALFGAFCKTFLNCQLWCFLTMWVSEKCRHFLSFPQEPIMCTTRGQ